MNDMARVNRHRKNVTTGGFWETYSFRLVTGCQEPIIRLQNYLGSLKIESFQILSTAFVYRTACSVAK